MRSLNNTWKINVDLFRGFFGYTKNYYNFAVMSKGLDNIGFISGFITKAYFVSNSYITVFQDRKGELRAIVVDDGFEVKEFEYAQSPGKMRKQKRAGLLS